jgi:asparagine synthase (glutamine-hydrolysing)
MEGAVGWDSLGHFVDTEKGLSDSPMPFTRVLIHTRLSIFDLSMAGRQPMSDRNGNWITYNGEIYNYRELRTELESLGCHFRSATDTEVILAAFEKWGSSCVNRFNGMWAFVIYSHSSRLAFCSRDRLGVKPFYYTRTDDGGFSFSSEIPSLLELLQRPARIDPVKLADYFIYGRTDDTRETMYSGVRELRGGHNGFLNIDTMEWQEERYWDLPEEPDLNLSDGAALDRFSAIFEDAVKLRLHADVPLALTVSGGIDSSVVAVAAAQSGLRPTLFTSHFPAFPAIDESDYAKRVARHLDLPHILVAPDLSNLLEDAGELSRAQAVPYGSLSLYVHWAILKEIRKQSIPIVLSGQGGDEVFFGYERYYVAHWRSLFPRIPAMLAAWKGMAQRSRLGSLESILFLVYFGLPGLQWLRRRYQVSKAVSKDLLSRASSMPDRLPSGRRDLQRQELQFVNLPRLLRYDDRTAGAQGMETRLPFLDYRLVEFAHRLPWHMFFRDGWTKYLLRGYLARHGLNEIAWRTHKLGFDAPTEKWTEGLLANNWKEYGQTDFARDILKPGKNPVQWPAQVRWDVYNGCEMAWLYNWQLTGS